MSNEPVVVAFPDGVHRTPADERNRRRGRPAGHSARSAVLCFYESLNLYYFVFSIFLASFVFTSRVVHSPFGNALKATHEKEPRAISLGLQRRMPQAGGVHSVGRLGGLAGSNKAIVFQLASLSDVHVVALDSLLAPFGSWFNA